MTNLVFNLQSPTGNTMKIDYVSNSYTLFYPCPSNSSCTPYIVDLPIGCYFLEVWGSIGGYYLPNLPAGGGYSYGEICLSQSTPTYIYLGGSGGYLMGGWNGGGKNKDNQHVNHGGGATDIRFVGDSLYHRVLVAGGSGGTSYTALTNPGAGGGISGLSSTTIDGPARIPGQPGNQTSGGKGGYYSTQPSYITGDDGGFGYGGDAVGYGHNGCGGGGGGWYGGGGSFNGASGPGGSGYALTSDSYKPSGYALGSQFYLSNTTLLNGNTIMPNPNGGYQTGHFGNGVARITIKTLNLHPTVTQSMNCLSLMTCNEIHYFTFVLFFSSFLILIQPNPVYNNNFQVVL